GRVGRGCRNQGVGQDAHSAATDQAVVPAVIIIQAKREHFRPSAVPAEDTQGALFHLGLDATASQGAALAAVGQDQHGGPSLLRRRAARLDQRTVNTITALVQGPGQLGEQLTHGSVQLTALHPSASSETGELSSYRPRPTGQGGRSACEMPALVTKIV